MRQSPPQHRSLKIPVAMPAILLFVLSVSLVGCSGLAANPSPTFAATAPALPPLMATATIAPTKTQTAPTSSPSPTSVPSPTPCAFAVQPDLSDFWDEGELGCAINPGQAVINTAYAPFEGGQMLWRSGTNTIYVLYNDGRWENYPNEWQQSSQEFSCGEESSPPTPIRGFGRVWCDHPDVREVLGAVTAYEIGDSASAVQDFGNGTILVAPFGSRFIFINETGMWRRVDVES